MPGTLYITGDAEADGLLNHDGTALLIGMLLDQQVPMEWAFAGPATLRRRLGHLDAERIAARDVDGGAELYRRLRALPGYGDEKARIFVAILAKTQGVTPAGWQEAAGRFGDDVPRSVADVTGPESLARVREWKRAQKAAQRDKQDRPLKPAR